MKKKPLKDINISGLKKEAIRRDSAQKAAPKPSAEDKLLKSVEGMANQMVAIAKKSDDSMGLVLGVVNEAVIALSGIKGDRKPREWEFKYKRPGCPEVTIRAKEIL